MDEGAGVDPKDVAADSGTLPSRVVGIGASAGGLESLEKFFRTLPADTGMAFVVVQHLSPDFKSMMDELLARHTNMQIEIASEGTQVERNVIYLMPPSREMTISDGKLHLTIRDPKHGLTLPIDIFFRSLAADCGPRSAGIILSGTGSDGSRGIKEISNAGGLVLCEHPESAKFDGMPRSAHATGVVDFLLEPEEMGKALLRDSTQVSQIASENVPDEQPVDGIAAIFELLRREYEIDFDYYKPATVQRRIERRLLLGPFNMEQYVARLQEDPHELNQLYHDLLIGVTSFFRDTDPFRELEEKIIPQIVDNTPETEDIRVWVAGCATGEEAYSIAILLHEALDERQRPLNVKIMASDAHKRSLDHANRGIYDEQQVSTVSTTRLRRFFTKKHEGYQVSQDLRQMIVFAQHNVIHDAPFTNLDLITCRNMLIYFQPAAQKKTLSLFHFGLKTDGILMLGSSETPGELASELETLDEHCKIYRKRRDVRLTHDMRLPLFSGSRESRRPKVIAAPFPNRGPEQSLLQIYDDLLERFMPPGFLVDENRELLHCFGTAEELLRPKRGRPSNDILEMVDPETRAAVAGALQRVIRQKKPVKVSGITLPLGGVDQLVKLTVEPVENKRSHATHYLIRVESVNLPEEISEPDSSVESLDVSRLTNDRVQFIEEELRFTKENLQTTIEELETANEEMQATNEELVASNEELQSTNEELHSVNEELYTVNAEHQSKIQELAELNRDTQHLLEAGDVATLFLDSELCIRKFTPKIASIFELLEQDIGRRISTFNHRIRYSEFVSDIERVLAEGFPIERDVQDVENCSFFLRMLPYKVGPTVEGVVISLVDTTAQMAARSRINHLSTIVESSNDAILSKDLNGIITSWNTGAERLYGYTAEEMIGQSVERVVPDNRLSEFQSILANLRNGECPISLQTQRIAKSGKILDVSLSFSLLYDRNQQLVGASAIGRDITQLKQISGEKEERERLFHLLLTSTAEAICGLDNEGKCTFCNPACIRLLGFDTEDELLGKKLHLLIRSANVNSDIRGERKDELAKAHKNGEEIHLEDELISRSDGTTFRAEIWNHPIFANGKLMGAVVTFLDITERKEAEEAVLQSELQFRDTFENAAVGMAHVGLDGSWLRVNDRLCEITGYSAEELVEISFQNITHPDDLDADLENVQALLSGEIENYSMEKRYYRKDSSLVWVNLTVSISQDTNGNPEYFISVIQDISQRKRIEDQFRSAVKQRDEFLAMMSHELRNPLSAARTATTVLGSMGTSPEIDTEARQVIDRQMTHMTRLLDDLLDVSRFTTGKLQMRKERVEIAEVIKEAVESISATARESDIELKVFLPDNPVTVFGDPHRLQQAVANLLGNAIKYSPAGSHVKLEISVTNAQLTVTVTDNGIGISPDLLSSVFEMFVQSESTLDRSDGGMGLGLTLVRTIVEAHGGTITASSEGIGCGSEFRFRIPVAESEPAQVEHSEEDAQVKKKFEKVMLVEDQPDARKMLKKLLELSGYQVFDYGIPEEALSQILEDKPDVAILDIGLPGMDGYELAKEIRLKDEGVYLVALTGYGQADDVQRAKDAGFNRHLVKPLKPGELQDVLSGTVGESN
jgi:two-component system CheB/CheR fusion protein